METRTEGDITIAVMVPRFDAYTANDVETELKELIAKGAKKIICDFSQTEYVASAGLRVLLSSAKSLQRSGGQILLVSMKPYVFEVFEISGFTQIFKIFGSEKEALQSLKQP
ncbi:MAG: STAS domain-containing protein [Candidatus Bathyarchaeota archaeon]|nr:STAS domain-containing protein [Candidatus Bathyarchaeota archaeon]